MRRNLFVALLTAALCVPAAAKAQTGYNPYAPVYNTAAPGQSYYSNNTSGTAPVYNNAATTRPVPLQQYIAGKNAPSYSFNNEQIQPYNGFGTQGPAVGTPAYVQMQNQQFQQQQLQQQQFDQQQAAGYGLRQPPLPGGIPGNGYNPGTRGANAYGSSLSGGPFGTAQQQQVPKKRRVVYKEMNNPLKEPARLFDPNQ